MSRLLAASRWRLSCRSSAGQSNVRDLPHPDVDWGAFVKEIKSNSSEDRWIYDPIDEKAAMWIDLNALTKMYNPSESSACCIS